MSQTQRGMTIRFQTTNDEPLHLGAADCLAGAFWDQRTDDKGYVHVTGDDSDLGVMAKVAYATLYKTPPSDVALAALLERVPELTPDSEDYIYSDTALDAIIDLPDNNVAYITEEGCTRPSKVMPDEYGGYGQFRSPEYERYVSTSRVVDNAIAIHTDLAAINTEEPDLDIKYDAVTVAGRRIFDLEVLPILEGIKDEDKRMDVGGELQEQIREWLGDEAWQEVGVGYTQPATASQVINAAIANINPEESSAEAFNDQITNVVGQIYQRVISPILESIEDINIREQVASGLGATVSEYINRAEHD